MIVTLYNIRSLFNVGAIFRTADAVGVSKIYCCGTTGTPYDEFQRPRTQLTKVSLGAEKTVQWEYVVRMGSLITCLKNDGYTVVALEQSSRSVPYYKYFVRDLSKTALIVGNEVRGLPASVLKSADTIIEIPMYGKKESLNVGVAFGVVAFHYKIKVSARP